MAEGSIWEAIQFAGFRQLDNLVAILDMNGLGQAGPTMLKHDAGTMAKRVRAFGWETIVIDGHNLKQILDAYQTAAKVRSRPVMIIAKTIKGKGVAMIEGQPGWHGKALNKTEAAEALKALGPVNLKLRGTVATPDKRQSVFPKRKPAKELKYKLGEMVAPREALGRGLARIGAAVPNLVVLDGEVKNSTYAELFEKKFPKRFIQAYIAEQTMVSLAGGLAARGYLPVTATFAAFFTRAFDQLRMAQYAKSHQVFIGTHVGVHIGQDGASQMGLQDIAMFRTLEKSIVLYPSDAVSAERLLEKALKADGIVYLRATRAAWPTIYKPTQRFAIGGSNVVRKSKHDRATIVAAGVTLHEALKAADQLARRKIFVRVVDLFSIKPIDAATLKTAARETGRLIVVEDHYPEGGVGEAVRTVLGKDAGKVISLAVRKTPKSGKPEELLAYEGIDAAAITKTVRAMV